MSHVLNVIFACLLQNSLPCSTFKQHLRFHFVYAAHMDGSGSVRTCSSPSSASPGSCSSPTEDHASNSEFIEFVRSPSLDSSVVYHSLWSSVRSMLLSFIRFQSLFKFDILLVTFKKRIFYFYLRKKGRAADLQLFPPYLHTSPHRGSLGLHLYATSTAASTAA
jgi:hypothetical protein